jgi:multiple sugar transport system permease protein
METSPAIAPAQQTGTPSYGTPSYRAQRILSQTVIYLTLILLSLIMVAPFVFMISTSLKPDREIFQYPTAILPKALDFSNYLDVWRKANFERYMLNTVFVSVGRTLLTLVTSTMAAYAFAKLRFPGRNVIFLFFVMTMMLPSQVTLIPVYVIIKRFPLIGGNNLLGEGGMGMINSFAGMIVPSIISVSGIFLLRQFISSLPDELLDAARIDGADEFRAFYSIVLPLVLPGIATLTIMTFQGAWNDFLWPLLVGQKKDLWLIQVALSNLKVSLSAGVISWPEMMAATVITTLPVILVFLFAQKYFIRSVALTGLK